MDTGLLIRIAGGVVWSPLTFGVLASLATALIWIALTPSRPARMVRERLDGYLNPKEVVEDEGTHESFNVRVLVPVLRRILHIAGAFAPKRNLEAMRKLLIEAGEPGGLSVLDFFGLRLLFGVIGGGFCFLVLKRISLPIALMGTIPVGGIISFLPLFWLRSKAKQRNHEITRALADALDMMTIAVEAGLAFESALLRVADRWDNALSREFRRAVVEMRLGAPRDVALQHVAERADVEDLRMFVAILVQANQLGLSIGQVLHSQAAQMRMRRRQRAEEKARQAGIKMLFPLVFLIFPALMVVVLGPAVPTLLQVMRSLTGGG
jgi:tight adherence protein C